MYTPNSPPEDLTRDALPAFLSQRQQDLFKALRKGQAAFSPELANCLRNSVSLLSAQSCLLALPCNSPGVEPVVDEKAMSVTLPISTRAVDRMGDVVEPRGCLPHLANYTANPRVFFSHRQNEMPVGSCRHPDGSLALSVEDDTITGTCYFHGETAESEVVFRLVKRKELQAASIGFLPVKAALLKQKAKGEGKEPQKTAEGERILDLDPFMPLRFLEWDLTEWSIVPIPANPEACASLTVHLEKGHVEGERIPASLRKSLEPFKLKARIWSPGFNPESSKFSGVLALGEKEVEYQDGKLVRFDTFSYPKEVDEAQQAQDNLSGSYVQPTTVALTPTNLEAPAQEAKQASDNEVSVTPVEDAPLTQEEEGGLELDSPAVEEGASPPEDLAGGALAPAGEAQPAPKNSPAVASEASPLLDEARLLAAVEAAVVKALTPGLLVKTLSALDEASGGALVGNAAKDKEAAECSAEVLKAVKATLELLTKHVGESTQEHREIMASLGRLEEHERKEAERERQANIALQKDLVSNIAQFNTKFARQLERVTGSRA